MANEEYEIAPSTALGVKLKDGTMGIQLPKRTAKPTTDCPFCDEYDAGDLASDTDNKATFYWVQCFKCEACGPTSYDPDQAVRLWSRTSRPSASNSY